MSTASFISRSFSMLTLGRTHLGDFAATLVQLWWCRNSWATFYSWVTLLGWLSITLVNTFRDVARYTFLCRGTISQFFVTSDWRLWHSFDLTDVTWHSFHSQWWSEYWAFNSCFSYKIQLNLVGPTWCKLQWVSESCFSYNIQFNRLQLLRAELEDAEKVFCKIKNNCASICLPQQILVSREFGWAHKITEVTLGCLKGGMKFSQMSPIPYPWGLLTCKFGVKNWAVKELKLSGKIALPDRKLWGPCQFLWQTFRETRKLG